MSFLNTTNLILNVSNSLKSFIKKEIGFQESLLTLRSPAEITPPQNGVKVSIFLYYISQNIYFKNQDLILKPDPNESNANELNFPPLVLDLYYLLTPIGDIEEEQKTLSLLMQSFYNIPVLPEEYLSSDLKLTENNRIKVILNDMQLEQINHLWSMFSNKTYKPGLSYLVTPIYIPSRFGKGIKRVLTKDTNYFTGKT